MIEFGLTSVLFKPLETPIIINVVTSLSYQYRTETRQRAHRVGSESTETVVQSFYLVQVFWL